MKKQRFQPSRLLNLWKNPASASSNDEVQEFKDKYLRQLAETKICANDMKKEKQEMARFGIDNVIAEILMPHRQSRKRAAIGTNCEAEVKNWALGFR